MSIISDFWQGGPLDVISGLSEDIFGPSSTTMAPAAVAPTISLIDGRVVQRDQVVFNPGNYTFTYQGENITNQVFRADAMTFPGFDVAVANDWAYRNRTNSQGYTDPGPPLSTDTSGMFWQGVQTTVSQGASSLGTNVVMPAFNTIVIWSVAGLVAYFLLKDELKL